MRTNLASSRSVFLPQPSAMLAAMEIPARRIWLVSPYISCAGKPLVAL